MSTIHMYWIEVYVWRSKGEALQNKNTLAAFNHCGDSVVLGCSFATSGVGTLHKMEMDEGYLEILKLQIVSKAWTQFGCSIRTIIPNTWKWSLEWINQSNIKLLEWPFQSHNLNPIEDLLDLCQETNLFKWTLTILPRRVMKHPARIMPEVCWWLTKAFGWVATCKGTCDQLLVGLYIFDPVYIILRENPT